MGGRLRKPTAALALALFALAWLPQAGQATRSSGAREASATLLGGVNVDGLGSRSSPAEADRSIALAQSLHARLIRAELTWSVLEPQASGQLDPHALAYTDRLMSEAAAHGIGVIVMVDSTPCWASAAPAAILRRCVPGQRSEANGYPPVNPADFAALARRLGERYAGSMTALEVWNEPDQANQKYFAGPNKPERYAAVLKAGYTAVKQVDPGVAVLAGSLVGSNGEFLRLLYKAGIKGYYDGLAVHFYTLTLGSVRAIRAVQLENGDSKPLWLGEFGWGNCYPRRIQEEQACVTSAIQALNITNTYRALATTDYVAAATLYELQDGGGDSFGVITTRDVHKPAFKALATVLASPTGPLSRVALRLRRSAGRVLASGSGPVGDFMQLEAFRGRTLRYRAVFILNRFNQYSIKLPRALGARGLRVRVFQYWSGAGSATQKSI